MRNAQAAREIDQQHSRRGRSRQVLPSKRGVVRQTDWPTETISSGAGYADNAVAADRTASN
jgi:hypothetical protein